MECSDSSDNDGHGNENDQELIIIPIKNRTKLSGEGYSTENGVTVINFDKSKHVVCDKCSLSLKSMKCLENHMKAQHNDSSFFLFRVWNIKGYTKAVARSSKNLFLISCW